MEADTLPRLQPIDAVLKTLVRHRDCAVLLTEARDHLSVILADSTHAEYRQELRLEGCKWLLFAPEFVGVLPMNGITVAKSNADHWEVTENTSGKLIRWPSLNPYLIAFMPSEEFIQLAEDITNLRVSTALDLIVGLFGSTPGFGVSANGILVAPFDYGSVSETEDLRDRMCDIPNEFRVN